MLRSLRKRLPKAQLYLKQDLEVLLRPTFQEGEDECKGGGEEAQEDMIREKKEGGTQMQVGPKLNFDINQQKSFNSGRNNTQGRLTSKNMMLNILIACGAMLGMTLRPVSGYSLEYYDCWSPTKINKFARPTVCDPLAADEEVATGTTFEVLTLAEVKEVPGWSCEVIVSEWWYRCGVFSHMKLSGVPHLPRHSPVTGDDCRGSNCGVASAVED